MRPNAELCEDTAGHDQHVGGKRGKKEKSEKSSFFKKKKREGGGDLCVSVDYELFN